MVTRPPPGVPLSAVRVPDPHYCPLPGTLRDDPETSQTSQKRVAGVDQYVADRRGECGERRARPESETRGLGVDARRSSGTPAPAPGPPGRRARVSCVRRPSSPRLSDGDNSGENVFSLACFLPFSAFCSKFIVLLFSLFSPSSSFSVPKPLF